jgi:hypothetical protein
MAPAVEVSMLIVAALGAVAGCSEAGWDLLQPSGRSAASKTAGTKERTEITLIFPLLKYFPWGYGGYPLPLPRSPFLNGLHDSARKPTFYRYMFA